MFEYRALPPCIITIDYSVSNYIRAIVAALTVDFRLPNEHSTLEIFFNEDYLIGFVIKDYSYFIINR